MVEVMIVPLGEKSQIIYYHLLTFTYIPHPASMSWPFQQPLLPSGQTCRHGQVFEIGKGVPLAHVAAATGSEYRVLKELNPHILKHQLRAGQ
jgi:hypothetical protein